MVAALVLLSGGIDSTVALYDAKATGEVVQGLLFRHTQQPHGELLAATRVAEVAGVVLHVAEHPYIDAVDLLAPDNTLYYAIATNVARSLGIRKVIGGQISADSEHTDDADSAYYDLLNALIVRKEPPVQVLQPLIHMSKREVVRHGHALGAPLEVTWSCEKKGEAPCRSCSSTFCWANFMITLVITTRDNPHGVARLLDSLSPWRQFLGRTIIVDDAVDPSTTKLLHGLCDASSVLVTRGSEPLLGRKNWNLGVARSIGGRYASQQHGYTLFLDDDMIVSRLVYPTIDLVGCVIDGCPDLSRLEWVELYLGVLMGDFGVGYPARFTVDQAKSSLSCYTDLPCVGGTDHSIPPRDELSGGAFLCRTELLREAHFANWYDEDWLWFDTIRKRKQITTGSSESRVFHSSRRKTITDLRLMLFEERGKILTAAAKQLLFQPCIPINTALKSAVEERLATVSAIYKRSAGQKQIQEVLSLLGDFVRKYPSRGMRMDLDRYLEAHEKYNILASL